VWRIWDVYPGSLADKKKIWANFQRTIEFFTQKIFKKLSKIWIWDPGSGKNLFRIPDPGVKKAPDPQHCQDVNNPIPSWFLAPIDFLIFNVSYGM
jgi:hypothetical protein